MSLNNHVLSQRCWRWVSTRPTCVPSLMVLILVRRGTPLRPAAAVQAKPTHLPLFPPPCTTAGIEEIGVSIEEVRKNNAHAAAGCLFCVWLGACSVQRWLPVHSITGDYWRCKLEQIIRCTATNSLTAQQPTAPPPIRPTVRLAALLHPPPGRALVSFHFCSVFCIQ